jgi:lipoprotein-anchoring transpeptidase ErfK/SrfK
MLNKYIVLGLISSFGILSYVPAANATYYGYGSSQINPQAWREFKRAKQAKYDMNHTLERAPFPQTISSSNVIKVDLSKLAWGAYDDSGKLVKWGDASGGKSFYDDIGKACKTVTGTYTIYSKKGSSCKSNLFPVPKGGAPMPYCMHFTGGYALHGGNVPDFNASHGCIRVPVQEAQWLNQNFVKVGKTRVSISYD